MTEKAFYNLMKTMPRTDYIVKIESRFNGDTKLYIENEVLEYDGNTDEFIWSYDWNEGQEYINIAGIIAVEDVIVPDWINFKEV